MDKATGGQILVEALRAQGVDRVYCVPGESYLPVLDALHDASEIAVVSARHEGAAANMAEADGKLTGRPGICFVTRGPGATHATVGVHTAFQDSTPMILFIGQVARHARDREGFQEVDFRAMFAPLAKWAAEIDSAARIPEYIARAYRVAMSGRAGPVVLSLPEDVLSEVITPPAYAKPISAASAAPRATDLDVFSTMIGAASKPLLVVGGTGWTASSCRNLVEFARRNELPLVASFRRQDLVDNRHDNYCGHLGLGADATLTERLKSADLVVSIGSRLGENTTNGYSLLTPTVPRQALIHVHPEANELGRVYQPELAIACGLADFADALPGVDVAGRDKRTTWLREAREAYLKFSTPAAPTAKYVDMAAVVSWLSEHLKDDALIANGAGNYTVWVHRYFRYRQLRTELAPTSGAMGYGVPAAIAGKLRYPDREVIAFAGDGCFQMYPQELGTAVQHGANVIALVVNNGTYGTIRMHQERRYPGRVVATDIVNPDFVAMARSYGAFAERLETTEGFPAAYRRAAASGKPAVLELIVDPVQLSPAFRIPAA
ncbi:thiamine pyrophosphate-binding protein [Steroidobacter agaridevorans]|uniref:thiamine pyrophosphate-binding protein n=1 Tax=Steroidobacter agaridevorans TaxID=2695856 RepID=UPI001326FA31|nr:thiamine pyrophosphate-binding protein [Steroidobacter agaridevorans]GFE88461.1 thiamine pyrophosphate protein [Steroidobacter agaridevorans]